MIANMQCGTVVNLRYMLSYRNKYQHYLPGSLNFLNFGVLTFVTTIVLPMNLGVTKLQPVVALGIFAAGFIPLFLLARGIDKTKPDDVDSNEYKDKKLEGRKSWNIRNEQKHETTIPEYEEIQIPFNLVKKQIMNMLYSYGDILDHNTKHKFILLCDKLEDMVE